MASLIPCSVMATSGVDADGPEENRRSARRQEDDALPATAGARPCHQARPLQRIPVEAAPVASHGIATTLLPASSERALSGDAADYLQAIPGMAAIRNGGANGDPVFRGQFGSRLNILSNDTAIMGGCGGRMDSPTAYLSPQSVDEVEMIRGPQTVLWGPMGSAATIRFIRDTPRFGDQERYRFHGALGAGTAGRNDQLADLSIGNPQFDARIIAQRSQAMDYHDGAHRQVPSRWEKRLLDTQISIYPTPTLRLTLDAGTSDGDARYATRNMDGRVFHRDSIALTATQRQPLPGVAEWRAKLWLNDTNHVMDNFSLRPPLVVNGNPVRMASNVGQLNIGARIAATMTPLASVQVTSGVDWLAQRHRFRRSVPGVDVNDFAHRPWLTNARTMQYGFFTETRWQLNDRARWIAGVRADYIQARDLRDTAPAGNPATALPTPQTQRQSWLPAGFLRYEYDLPGGATRLYAGLGYTQRFPDYWELFMAGKGPAGTANAFSGIAPERTTQIDLGAQYASAGHQAWINAYLGSISDFILFNYQVNTPTGLTSQVRNIQAQVMGMELGGSMPVPGLLKGLRSELTLASAWGRNVSDGRPLPQMPPLDVRFGLRYERGPVDTGLLWRVVAPQRRFALNNGNVAGQDLGPGAGFAVFSLDARWQISRSTRLSAGIDNVFNKYYTEHLNRAGSAGFGYASGTPVADPGRSAWIRVNIDI